MSQQREDLDRLRGRAVTLISVASIAAAVLGGLSLPKKNAGGTQLAFFSLGLLAFVVLVALTCWLLRPVVMTFENDAAEIAGWIDQGYTTDDVYAGLATHSASHFKKNRETLLGMYTVYQVAIVALGVVVFALALALGLGAA